MEEKQYLDWEGLQLYDRLINQKIQRAIEPIINQKLTFTKNGDEVSSFSASNYADTTLEILNDQDIINVIKYGQSDISGFNDEQLEELNEDSSILAKVAKSGSYSDLKNCPTSLSQFENNVEYVSSNQLQKIT